MGLIQEGECAVAANARRMASSLGLDPNKVVCCGSPNGTDCVYSPESPVAISGQDMIQDFSVREVEGQANLGKFYDKLEKHTKLLELQGKNTQA